MPNVNSGNIEQFEELIFARAKEHELNPAVVAAKDFGFPVVSKQWWWKPHGLDECEDVFIDNIDLTVGMDNTLSRFVSSLAHSIQFPKSSALLHAMGVVSAAMVENFYYEFNGGMKNTVALYTVAAQPPSTGKSAIDSYLTNPVHEAYQHKTDENKKFRAKQEIKIGSLKAKIKKSGDREAEEMAVELVDMEEELAARPIYNWCVNDPTPEGCERTLGDQGGFFNVVSDETSAVNVILGTVYGDGKGARNNGVFLKAWDNGYLSVSRSGRDGYKGHIRGSMAVLAQDASIESILEAGQGGEGISERFLILREKNLLGARNHQQYTPIDNTAKQEYADLIKNVVNNYCDVQLQLSTDAEKLVRSIKQEQEPLMADGGKYSCPMLRGVVGKNEKQIIKLACVLHVVNEWSNDGKKSREIPVQRIFEAHVVFNQLLRTYVAAADSQGFTGHKTELNRIIEALKKQAGKNKSEITTANIKDNIKKSKIFKPMSSILTKKLREEYLPTLERSGHVVYLKDEDRIFINPYLKD